MHSIGFRELGGDVYNKEGFKQRSGFHSWWGHGFWSQTQLVCDMLGLWLWNIHLMPMICKLIICMNHSANFIRLLEGLSKIKYLQYVIQTMIDIIHREIRKSVFCCMYTCISVHIHLWFMINNVWVGLGHLSLFNHDLVCFSAWIVSQSSKIQVNNSHLGKKKSDFPDGRCSSIGNNVTGCILPDLRKMNIWRDESPTQSLDSFKPIKGYQSRVLKVEEAWVQHQVRCVFLMVSNVWEKLKSYGNVAQKG